jgi:hypothetical protein
MPNWCNNTIVIEGPAEKIRALWAAATTVNEEHGLLNALNPMPEDLADTVADGSAMPNWYNWRVTNWGTKWDVNQEGLEFSDLGDGRARIEGYADSAWAPPLEAFYAYADLNEDVYMELKYFEPGMSFMGAWDTVGVDAYYDDVGDILEITEEEDAVVYELLEHFDVWSWYDSGDANDVEDEAAEAADEDVSKED